MTTETDFVIRNLHFKLNWTGEKNPSKLFSSNFNSYFEF